MNIVQVGDLWEADDRLFWILGIRRSLMLGHSMYEYVELTAEVPILESGHLTIQREDLFKVGVSWTDYWKKIA